MPKGFPKTNFLNSDVPEVVLNRLPIYLRILNQLQQQQVKVTNSKELATYMTVEPSQIRKDLTYIGRFGLNGKGYSVKTLKNNLQKFLGLDASWNTVLIGGGRLGKSAVDLINQQKNKTFRIAAAFDPSPNMVGKRIMRMRIQNLKDLERTLKTRNIKIGIIATSNNSTQVVANILVNNRINYIIN
ncbi:uncharacterized protein METZ01_LOCUS340812, partial [marine metagenome]